MLNAFPNIEDSKFIENFVMFPSKLNIQELVSYPVMDSSTQNLDSSQTKYYVKGICKNLPFNKKLRFISFNKVILLSDLAQKEMPNPAIPSSAHINQKDELSSMLTEETCDRSSSFEMIDEKSYKELKNAFSMRYKFF